MLATSKLSKRVGMHYINHIVQRATSNVFAMFNQDQIQEFKVSGTGRCCRQQCHEIGGGVTVRGVLQPS